MGQPADIRRVEVARTNMVELIDIDTIRSTVEFRDRNKFELELSEALNLVKIPFKDPKRLGEYTDDYPITIKLYDHSVRTATINKPVCVFEISINDPDKTNHEMIVEYLYNKGNSYSEILKKHLSATRMMSRLSITAFDSVSQPKPIHHDIMEFQFRGYDDRISMTQTVPSYATYEPLKLIMN